jgi:hypothetical protein
MRDAVRSRQEMERGKSDFRDELRRYLENPLSEGIMDIPGYWGVSQFQRAEEVARLIHIQCQHQATEYPTPSRMARDYLAIQGSATPSEQAFSSGGITGTRNRNGLASFEALQLLKSAYRNGHIMAADEAAKRVDLSFDTLKADSK